ncbi:MAG: glucose 1-dehydrogenase [Gammaproteobacteria bacterium]|nr:glucose 1-dehydrogenase [Gammaproteobacteria bacterium]MCH9743328.1 glucose 1-dehydrogenase [Gammaproteobacteria bacterium]
MNDYSLKDKVVIVTGATKGMGLASSKRLLQLGAKVVMVYANDEENANRVLAELDHHKSQILLLQADITNHANRERIVQKTLSTFNAIDVLVNNAGIPVKAGFLKESEEDFDRVVDVNLKAPIFLAQLVAKQMIEQNKGGSIINISSVCGHRGMGGASYDAAKAGIIRASQTMANKLGQYGIRVNSVSPGTHKTEMNRYHWENETDLHKGMMRVTALGRAAEADEIAGTIIYLASSQSSYTTGADILVDGGFLSHCPGRN